jgi:hypothetical protein
VQRDAWPVPLPPEPGFSDPLTHGLTDLVLAEQEKKKKKEKQKQKPTRTCRSY